MKSVDASSGNYTGELVETSKTLFTLADTLNLCVVWTQQISLHSTNTRYISEYNLASSKQVTEVASQVILLREVWEDEFEDEKFDIVPYNLKKDKDGNYLKDNDKHAVKELLTLDRENGKHILAFLAKNRTGDSGKVYVFKQIPSYNVWNELGFCTVSHVNRN